MIWSKSPFCWMHITTSFVNVLPDLTMKAKKLLFSSSSLKYCRFLFNDSVNTSHKTIINKTIPEPVRKQMKIIIKNRKINLYEFTLITSSIFGNNQSIYTTKSSKSVPFTSLIVNKQFPWAESDGFTARVSKRSISSFKLNVSLL